MEDTYAIPAGEENILDDADVVQLCQASTGKRLFNYIVDYIISWVIYRYVIYRLVVAFITAIYQYVDSKAGLYVISYLIVIGWYTLFRTAFEGFTGGKTIAKFMNGTRAVNEDGTRITFKTALLRSLSRMVPFEAFSALGANPPYPWHDRWTRTYVIDESQSRLAINE
jgi:uncharacterized RDD family membrane protein YckC